MKRLFLILRVIILKAEYKNTVSELMYESGHYHNLTTKDLTRDFMSFKIYLLHWMRERKANG